MYEKIYEEMEQLCTSPSPIVIDNSTPQDKHVGVSAYNKNGELVCNEQSNGEGDDSVDALSASMPGLLGEIGEVAEKMEEEIGKGKSEDGLEVNVDDIDADLARRTSDTELLGLNRKSSTGYLLPDVSSTSIRDLDNEDSRLRGGVYFGYGLMNIVVSLIPPKLMKLANLFGFRGSRKVGLQALEYASHSQDMKAPLARWVWLLIINNISFI